MTDTETNSFVQQQINTNARRTLRALQQMPQILDEYNHTDDTVAYQQRTMHKMEYRNTRYYVSTKWKTTYHPTHGKTRTRTTEFERTLLRNRRGGLSAAAQAAVNLDSYLRPIEYKNFLTSTRQHQNAYNWVSQPPASTNDTSDDTNTHAASTSDTAKRT